MIFERILERLKPARTFDRAGFAKRMVLMGIDAADDPTDMKQRIMTAREHGHLSDEETTAMIRDRGLKHA